MKKELSKKELNIELKKNVFIKHSDISRKGKDWLVEQVEKHGTIFISMDGAAPLKITKATLG